MAEVNVNNAAAAIMEKADEIINEVIAGLTTEQERTLAVHLICKDLWDRLTELLGFDADDLRTAADRIDEDDDS